ncbi:hypothetical protein ACMU_07125 [Actibacterium mucosum KCTC 23349]|uniref:Uncharacterized protein n=1 Tax=Actibacterium mucosum KCTC 23349 TaxID=1454373 RepID=A0A037ZJT4_9RHOB|nr:hypothetical protein ACMU_07125 [Actibacterium mucosum KCTC 23349]
MQVHLMNFDHCFVDFATVVPNSFPIYDPVFIICYDPKIDLNKRMATVFAPECAPVQWPS